MLEQMAEECTELAQALLKKARKLRNDNPTPKTYLEIERSIVEEYTDVCMCADILKLIPNGDIYRKKYARWIQRLTDHYGSMEDNNDKAQEDQEACN